MRKILFLAVVLISGSAFALGPFQGFGQNATGGSTPCHASNVSTLNTCATAGGKSIIFDAGGTYTVSSDIIIAANTTLDCATAPTVVTFIGGGTNTILGAWNSNIIIHGCRFRTCTGDCIEVCGGGGGVCANHTIQDVVVDHNDLIGCGDGCIDVTSNSHEVTVSWNMMGHSGGTFGGSGATLIKYGPSYHVSFHHNLWAQTDGNDRQPWCEAGDDFPTTGTPRNPGVICDIRYNVESQWTAYGIFFDNDNITTNNSNAVSNYIDGPSGRARNGITVCTQAGAPTQIYAAGNVSVQNAHGDGSAPGCFDGTPVPNSAITKTNQPGTASVEYTVPAVTGPCAFDNTAGGRVATWQSVISGAGVISFYADDSAAATLRASVTTPTVAMLSSAWNTQTGSCSSGVPPAPASHLLAVVR